MFELRTITLLICATAVLTSNLDPTQIKNSSEQAREGTVESFDEPTEVQLTSKPIVASTKNITNDDTDAAAEAAMDDQNLQDEYTNDTSNISKTGSIITVEEDGIEVTPDTPDDEIKLAKEERTASIVARKGAFPDTGITPSDDEDLDTSVPTQSTPGDIDETHSSIETIADSSRINHSIAKIDSKTSTKNITDAKNSSSAHFSLPAATDNSKSTLKINSTTPATSITKIKINESSTTSSSPTTKRFKPKPTITIGEMDVDKPIPASPTKTPPLGMPRKIDYIVPVMITIIALPFLGGAAFLLWRRSRDCWDKRHYRRMDFLIDGMYNDHSWK